MANQNEQKNPPPDTSHQDDVPTTEGDNLDMQTDQH